MSSPLSPYSRLASLLAGADALAVVASYAAAVRWLIPPSAYPPAAPESAPLVQAIFIAAFALFFPLMFSMMRLYQRRVWDNTGQQIIRLGCSLLLGFGIYAFLQAVTSSPILLPNLQATSWWFAVLLTLECLVRFVAWPGLRRLLHLQNWKRAVVIVGRGQDAKRLAQRSQEGQHRMDRRVVGFVDDCGKIGEELTPGVPWLGKPSELGFLYATQNVRGALIAARDLPEDQLMALIRDSADVFGHVDIHDERLQCLIDLPHSDTYGGWSFVRFRRHAKGPGTRIYKRVAGTVVTAICLTLLLPVFIITGLLIKGGSKGPVFYLTNRVGHQRQSFRLFKFRSMASVPHASDDRTRAITAAIQNADVKGNAKIRDESRVTRVGRVIRKFGIDELPQFFNVLRGEMRLIGPRPSPENEFELNEEWHRKRFDIEPGCTGLWKLYAIRHEQASFNQMVLHDLYYSHNVSPLLDLYVLAGTIRVILSGRVDG
jgi:lipopolysaccharide/colanic/teichoic acid biosynthesis glycosyltransferase